MNATAQQTRRDWYAALFILALALLFFLPALDASVVQREQELRVALTARDMADGGSWLTPHYLGQLRLRKPPLMYWLVATSYHLGGSTNSAFLARIPSAISGITLSLLIFLIARDFFRRRRAIFAAIICATSFIILRQGRLAETDVLLTLWVTLAVWSGYRALFTNKRMAWTVLAGLASGVGFMTKGPAAFALPLFAWIGFMLIRRRSAGSSRGVGGTLAHFALWIFFALLVAAPWYGYLAIRAGSLAQLHQELSATFGETTQHAGQWQYYLYTLFQALAPWSLLIPFSISTIWRGVRRNNELRFALVWFATTFLALTFTSSKQIHYCTLLAPPASLLLGWYLRLLLRRRKALRQLSTPFLIVYLIATLSSVTRVMPATEPTQLIKTIVEQNQAAFANAEQVFLIGRNRATLEFHVGRSISDMDSIKEALRHAKPGDILFFNNNTAEIPPTPQGTRLVAADEQRGLRCVIWEKLEDE